jgi:hypothetical protein
VPVSQDARYGRSVLSELGRAHAYVSCVEHSKPGALLQAILNQLRVRRGGSGRALPRSEQRLPWAPGLCVPRDCAGLTRSRSLGT